MTTVRNIDRNGHEFDPATVVIGRNTPGFEAIRAEIIRITNKRKSKA